MRVVVDSNVLVSALIAPRGASGRLLRRLIEGGRTVFLISPGTMDELRRVLCYPKITKLLHFSSVDVESFLSSIEMLAEEISEDVPALLPECRDPDDVKFLMLAVSGRADVLITGDHDLLILEKVEGIPIVSPSQALAIFKGVL